MATEIESKYTAEDLEEGSLFLKEGHVRQILFSGGTYQIEVVDGEPYWIFLQIDSEGRVSDQFCTCAKASTHKTCGHLAAGYLAIFRGSTLPLHMRFENSLWQRIFTILAKRKNVKAENLIHEGDTYKTRGEKPFFSLTVHTERTRAFLKEVVDERKIETEETSLKFSNLPPEELELWRKGRPSSALAYELSFWSDVAKYLMILEDEGEVFTITFLPESGDLPQAMRVESKELSCELTILNEDWPEIIPSLEKYTTSLKVFALRDILIEKITYDAEHKCFRIFSKPLSVNASDQPLIQWDNWIYRKGIGFFSKKSDPILKKEVIPEEEVLLFLTKYSKILENYLEGEVIHRKPRPGLYHLFFDEKDNLHISLYAFTPNDLTKGKSFFFDPWAYIEGKGFFLLSNLLFKGTEKVIPKEYVPEFIERNKLWLNRFDGFQIHLSSIETKMNYTLEGGALKITADSSDTVKGMIDFGSWAYVVGQGFFSKGAGKRKKMLPKEVPFEEISNFLHKYKEELSEIPGFFFLDAGLEKSGLNVTLDDKQQIVIEPKFQFKEWSERLGPRIFGDFIFLQDKGFYEIPDPMKIPERYLEKTTLSVDQVPYFIKHELKRIQPYVFFLDKRLMEPGKLRLSLRGVRPEGKGWLCDLAYVSSYGKVPLFDVYQALLRFCPFLLSDAGMLHLTDKRFHFLSRLSLSQFNEKGDGLFLSTLDWIRLSLLEDVTFGKSENKEEEAWMKMLSSLQDISILELPNLKGLQSSLRPYQEIGVRFLWFLYSYGLSGFLCDEMGLGKTHQTMALMQAIHNEKKKGDRKQFLVVSPTSVVYHWQELLEKFLPKMKVHLYHGPFRSPKELKMKVDLILTTYGILRSDKELFQKMDFELGVFDEMQVAKNQKSQIHTVLRQIKADMKLALTGTPIENRLSELKSLFDIILPKYLPSNEEFKEEFVQPIEKAGDTEKQKALSLLVKPFILRRKKQDVLQDLPEKIEEISYVDLSPEQEKMYYSAALESKKILEESGGEFYMHVFALLNKLKQICDHPALVHRHANFHEHASGKWDLFVDLLEEARASSQKMVVFSQYLGMLDIMEAYLKEQNIGFASIRGSTKDRKGEVKRFQEDPSCEVFLGSLQAAGVGINLTAASIVVHYDRWWNPAKEDQATDRVHRIGQNRGVSVFKFVTKNTVEEHIHSLIEKKKNLIQNIVSYDTEEEIKQMNREELTLLLKKIYTSVKSS
ncbi:MAG: DEAD/DEAH box helicase [Verrucomicrobia bacterium]|nr:DEAD/DEAH box helicase [Verrucomicrobiota bacterium]